MLLQTLYIGHRDTKLCTLISYILLCFTLTFALPQDSSSTPFCHSYPLPPSAAATTAAATRDPTRSILSCSHHCTPTHPPGAISDPSHRSNSDRVEMYCATMFYRHLIYSSIVKKTDSSLAAASEVYLHLPYCVLLRRCPVIRLVTWV